MLLWIRIESRILSGMRGFAEAYICTGPPNCGKSKLLLRTIHPMGDGAHNLARLLRKKTTSIAQTIVGPTPAILPQTGSGAAELQA